MPFSHEDRLIVKQYRLERGWGAKKLLSHFPNHGWTLGGLDYLIKKIDTTRDISRRPGSGRHKTKQFQDSTQEHSTSPVMMENNLLERRLLNGHAFNTNDLQEPTYNFMDLANDSFYSEQDQDVLDTSLNKSGYNSEEENFETNEDGDIGLSKLSDLGTNAASLQQALELVQSRNMSIMHAAKEYGIPRETLRRYALMVWATATAARKPKKGKHETALSATEEAYLVSMITKMSRSGKYINTMDVKSTVQTVLNESHRMVFKDRNRPNAGWVQRFRKRHKGLQIKGSGYTIKKQTPITYEDIVEWHNEIADYLKTDWNLNINTFLTEANAQRIYNLDEISIAMNNKQDLIFENITSTRGYEDVYSVVTIMAAVSASGELTQPLILQKGGDSTGNEDDIMALDQDSFGISFSVSGKMNSEVFNRWLEAFDRELSEKGIDRPVVIYLDDAFAHFHISVFSFALDNGIILLCLPSQPTCVMHPIKTEFLDGMKEAYRIFSREYYKETLQPITTDQFPLTFLRAWEAMKEEENVAIRLSEAFRNYGLVPFEIDSPGLPDILSLAEKTHQENLAMKCDGIKPKPFEMPPRPTSLTSLIPIKRKLSETELLPSVKLKKVEPIMQQSEDKQIKTENDLPLKLPLLETIKNEPLTNLAGDRLAGRIDGIKKCMELIESLIPPDMINVYKSRTDGVKASSEIPYCMWKSVRDMQVQMANDIHKLSKKGSINLT